MQMKMKLNDLLRPGASYEVELGKELGGGGQGHVFQLSRFETARGLHVLKLYHEPAASADGVHLVGFTRFLDDHPAIRMHPGLAVPIYAVEDPQSRRAGCICLYAPGINLTRQAYADLYHDPQGLRARLKASARVADAIRVLHQHGVVLADINETNLLYHAASTSSIFCDVDGGGVLLSPRSDSYLKDLAPLMKGRFEENFLAPELIGNAGASPSLASDRWSLAALIHKLVFGGLNPYFGMPYLHALKNPDVWPAPSSQPAQQRWIAIHRFELARLGKILENRFRSVFDRRYGDNWHSALRPAAEDWVRDLNIAAEWTTRCHACGDEFVSEGIQLCTFCGAGGHHFKLQTPCASFSLDREGQSLTARHLGLSDSGGRYEVAVFHIQGGRLLMTAREPVQISESKQWLSRSETFTFEPGPPTWSFCARAKDGRSQVAFRVSAPDWGLRKMVSTLRDSGTPADNMPTAA